MRKLKRLFTGIFPIDLTLYQILPGGQKFDLSRRHGAGVWVGNKFLFGSTRREIVTVDTFAEDRHHRLDSREVSGPTINTDADTKDHFYWEP